MSFAVAVDGVVVFEREVNSFALLGVHPEDGDALVERGDLAREALSAAAAKMPIRCRLAKRD